MKSLLQVVRPYRWLTQYLGVCGLVVLVAASHFSEGPRSSFTTKSALAQKRSPSDPKIENSAVVPVGEENSLTPMNSESPSAEVAAASPESTLPRFEAWMLCRTDDAEIFFSIDALSQGNGQVSMSQSRNKDVPEIFANTQVQEFVKSPSRFVLKLSSSSNLSRTQVEILAEKSDNDAIYQGTLKIYRKMPDEAKSVPQAINCTPLTRPANLQNAS